MKKLLKSSKVIIKKAMPFVLIIAILYIIAINDLRKQDQNEIDDSFTNQLVLANGILNSDYNKSNDEGKAYLRTTAAGGLYSSLNLMRFSSYINNEDRNDLFGAINNLYLCMTNSNTSKVIFTTYNEKVNQYLVRIIRNPKDKEACKALDELTYSVLNSK
ncbi:hypothetical protein [Clostridium folliculivorans]|uniref:Uncharacterized protein n=1 Tax=Clostridium folliculivorans TaxID=2886038 RepID=A0A9W5Y1W0_9CLOT|nr:hypothetical protein [Clostridium folliculivorans]GKU25043.1 hypothetical protein CFOLD11_18690 [Clostridium folliculivorans]GKU31141.1 hypothetical protein CFB3_32480 [Clostridium folliculivorans]